MISTWCQARAVSGSAVTGLTVPLKAGNIGIEVVVHVVVIEVVVMEVAVVV